MRIAVLAIAVLALTACKVSKDEQNDTITAEFNQDVAENGLEEVGNFAENVASDIGNDVEQTADKIENTDVDVKVDSNEAN